MPPVFLPPQRRRLAVFTAVASLMLMSACATREPAQPASPPPTLQIAQTERGAQIVLPSVVLFEVGQASFNAKVAGPYLDRIADLLRRKTTRQLSVEGHTDSDGAPALNEALSKSRAVALAEALVARKVEPGRISTAGFSFNRPVASNATEEGKRLNRRVEIIVLDEKVETLTAGEPAGSFEAAWDKLKNMIDQGLVKPVGVPS